MKKVFAPSIFAPAHPYIVILYDHIYLPFVVTCISNMPNWLVPEDDITIPTGALWRQCYKDYIKMNLCLTMGLYIIFIVLPRMKVTILHLW
jgi:hypothetical protein